MMSRRWSLLLLVIGISLHGVRSQVECLVPNCICLVPIGTFCNMPVQDLSGYRGNLPTIQPGSFSQAGYIRNLSLSNNDLLTLQNTSFEGLVNILSLDLSNNMLADLPDGLFSQMSQLISLDLRRNSLTSLNPEAFRGLENLQILNLQSNQLHIFPATDLQPLLPSLTTIQLSGNPFDCSAPEIIELYSTLTTSSLDAVDSAFVTCSNGTLVLDLQFDLPTPTSSLIITPTPITSTTVPTSSIMVSTSSRTAQTSFATAQTSFTTAQTTPQISFTIAETSSSAGGLMTSSISPTSSPMPSPTPTPVASTNIPGFCQEETTLTLVGYLVWSQTIPGEKASYACPNGPMGTFAQRMCVTSGVWSLSIEDQGCSSGSATEQLLASVSSSEVTEANSEELSQQLASLLPESPLSLQELGTVTELAEELAAAGARDIVVLNNTLQVLDNVLETSSSSLSEAQGREISTKIRAVVDALLLDALSINQTQLVLSFSHLAVGGAYLSATNSTHLLASIRQLMNGGVAIDVGSEDGDVVVEVDGNSTVQVTVYDGDDLFTEAQCPNITAMTINTTVRGEVVTPIISVTTEDMPPGADDEEVTITYSRAPYGLMEGDRYVCARWNSSVNCGGGGWTVKDCSLIVTPGGNFQCKCLHQGTFTLLDIPAEATPPLENVPLISRVIFYILSTASIPLYLVIIITILATRELRCLPVLQCVVNQSLSQGLTFLVLAVSFERDEILGVCFVLGVGLQYLYLVSLSWLVAHPLLLCVSIFRRMLYEKEWLIVPFIVICWVWPAVPVTVYGGLRYQRITDNTTFICWIESSLFPGTITYLTAITVAGVVVVVLTCMFCLRCSDYTVETSTYLHLASNLPNLLLLLGVILTQYFTAAADSFHINPDYILVSVGGCALLCGSYFFLANAMFRSKIRNPLFCREDPVTKNKTAGYSTGQVLRPTPEESVGSNESTPQPFHRKFARRNDKTTTDSNPNNLNYVSDYLGSHQLGSHHYGGGRTGMNPVPLSLFGQVQPGAGRVRRSGDVSGLGPNPAYRLDLSSDV